MNESSVQVVIVGDGSGVAKENGKNKCDHFATCKGEGNSRNKLPPRLVNGVLKPYDFKGHTSWIYCPFNPINKKEDDMETETRPR
jgi:hypothetical protein